MVMDERRQKALEEYKKKLFEHRELDSKLKKRETGLQTVSVLTISDCCICGLSEHCLEL